MSIHTDWRKGQIAFNVLAIANPELARKVQEETDFDPYYDDTKLDDFWAYIARGEK